MPSSRKLMVAIVVATVGVVLIGLGVRASFTTSVDVTQTISTGNVNALITDLTWEVPVIDGVPNPIEVGGAPFSPGVGSANIGISSNNGSNLDEIFTLTVINNGTLPMSLNCTLSAGASDSAAMNNELEVTDPNADIDPFGHLTDVENNGTNLCQFQESSIPAGGTITQSIEIFGNLQNDAQSSSISPLLTVSGQDETSGGMNQPTP